MYTKHSMKETKHFIFGTRRANVIRECYTCIIFQHGIFNIGYNILSATMYTLRIFIYAEINYDN